MNFLLDSHTFLWWIVDNGRLSPKVFEIISDGSNELFLSAASGWELAIKARLGKLTLPDDPIPFISQQIKANNFQELPISIAHALQTYTLPNYHRDPFDRILIAQSQLEQLPILTIDRQINRYAVKTIW